MFIRIIGIVILVCVLLVMFNGCGMATPGKSASRIVEHREKHEPGSATQIIARNGAVMIEADAECREVEILARMRCEGTDTAEAEARLMESRISVERQADGTLVVRPVFARGERHGDAASFTIRMPTLAAVTVQSSNGSVFIAGASGQVEVESSNGTVYVEDQSGPVRVATSDGAISLAQRPGSDHPFFLESSNGAIGVRASQAFAGRVAMRTSNGPINVKDHGGRISSSDVQSGRGRGVVVVGAPDERDGAESTISTSNGTVTFGIGAARG